MKKLPNTLEKLILFIEEQGLDWTTGKHSREDTSIYWAEISPIGESERIRSRGEWHTPIDALKDAYGRYIAKPTQTNSRATWILPKTKGCGLG